MGNGEWMWKSFGFLIIKSGICSANGKLEVVEIAAGDDLSVTDFVSLGSLFRRVVARSVTERLSPVSFLIKQIRRI